MKRRAFSLTELIIAILLIGIVSASLFMLLKTPIDLNVYSQKEFDVQADMRSSSGTINGFVKNATAAFLLTKKDEVFKRDWNYFICEEKDNYSRLLFYEWDGRTHVKRVLSEFPSDSVKLSINFQRNDDGSLLKYMINAADLTRNKKYDIDSEVKVLNTVNIIDESKVDNSLTPPRRLANCLAFRSDRPDPTVSNKGYHHVSVSFVLDTSGSMSANLLGKYKGSAEERRIGILKKILKDFMANIRSQDVGGIVDIRIYPFAKTMSDSNKNFEYLTPEEIKYMLDIDDPALSVPAGVDLKYKTFFNVKRRADKVPLFFDNMINSLNVGGGTNPGDGLRFAYHGMKEYEEQWKKKEGNDRRIKHYLFVLTDGIPNIYSWSFLKNEPSGYDGVGSGEIFTPHIENKKDHSIYRKVYCPKGTRKTIDRGSLTGHSEDTKTYFSWSEPGSLKYIEHCGKSIKNYRTSYLNEPVDVTVVGFSGVPSDLVRCNIIGEYLGASLEDGKYYKHCSSENALKAVFQGFTESVLTSALWYVSGPQ